MFSLPTHLIRVGNIVMEIFLIQILICLKREIHFLIYDLFFLDGFVVGKCAFGSLLLSCFNLSKFGATTQFLKIFSGNDFPDSGERCMY